MGAIDSRHMEVFQLEPSQMRGYQIKRLHMAVEEVHRKFRHPGKAS